MALRRQRAQEDRNTKTASRPKQIADAFDFYVRQVPIIDRHFEIIQPGFRELPRLVVSGLPVSRPKGIGGRADAVETGTFGVAKDAERLGKIEKGLAAGQMYTLAEVRQFYRLIDDVLNGCQIELGIAPNIRAFRAGRLIAHRTACVAALGRFDDEGVEVQLSHHTPKVCGSASKRGKALEAPARRRTWSSQESTKCVFAFHSPAACASSNKCAGPSRRKRASGRLFRARCKIASAVSPDSEPSFMASTLMP